MLELGKHPFGLNDRDLAGRLGVSTTRLNELLEPLTADGAVRRIGAIWLTDDQWQTLRARLTDALAAYHRAQPLRSGMPKEELRSKTAIPSEAFAGALTSLVAEGTLVERAGEVALRDHRQGLTPAQEAAVGAFLAELELQPFNPPPLADLVRRHRLTPALLQYLVTQKRVVRVNDDTVFARSAYDAAVNRLRTHLTEHRTLTVAAARDVLGSSRRYVLPLLEWLDAQKITRRVGDDRILRD
jgi:selenocysteine-specific elongation factor